jgi:predicted Zn-dependent protease
MKKISGMGCLAFILFCTAHCNDDVSTLHQYFCANYSHFQHNISQAQRWYETLFSGNRYSLYTNKGYLHLLSDTKQYDAIIKLMPTLQEKFAKDAEIQLIFISALEKKNQNNKADEHLLAIHHNFKTHADMTLRTAQTYMRRKELSNALSVINDYLNNSPRKPHNFLFYYLSSHIYLQLGNHERAAENITICLDMQPRFDKGWLLQATLNEKQGMLTQAINDYSTFLSITGKNATIEKHLTDLLQKRSTMPLAQFSTSYVKQATKLYEKKEYQQALTLLRAHIETHPSDAAYILHIKLLAKLKQYDQLTLLCSQLITNKQCDDASVAQTLHQLIVTDNKNEKLPTILQSLADTHSTHYWLLLYASDIALRTNSNDNAITMLNQSITHIIDSTLKAKVYLQLGLLYYEKNDYAQMLTSLEKGYALNSCIPTLNNALAYYFATKGNNLQKAQDLVSSALQSEPDNIHFLDTQATIYYKEKKYVHAQNILEKCDLNNHPSSQILLAKIHYRLDNKEDALACINKITHVAYNERDAKKLQKLQTQLTTTG